MNRPTRSLDDIVNAMDEQVTSNLKKAPANPKIGPKEAQTMALRGTRSLESAVAQTADLADKPRPAKSAGKAKKMTAKKKVAKTAKKAVKKAPDARRPAKKKSAKKVKASARKRVAAPTIAKNSKASSKVNMLKEAITGKFVSSLALEKQFGWVNNTLRSLISNINTQTGVEVQRQRIEGVTYYRWDAKPPK